MIVFGCAMIVLGAIWMVVEKFYPDAHYISEPMFDSVPYLPGFVLLALGWFVLMNERKQGD
jgi:hypothetical protein